MSAIFFLIIIGIAVAGAFLAAFIWAVRSGQYEDDYSPSVRILFDEQDAGLDEQQENHSQGSVTKEASTPGKELPEKKPPEQNQPENRAAAQQQPDK